MAQSAGTQCLFVTDVLNPVIAEFWQDTLANANWRSIQVANEPGVDFDIRIDADALNNGVIPTAPGQGHYKSEEDYLNTLSALLGVDVQSTKFFLSVKGSTIKSSGEYLLDSSTGVFIYDALTDEKGRIYIDGVDMTAYYINPDRFHDYEIDYSKLNSTQLDEVNALNGNAPFFNAPSTYNLNLNSTQNGPSPFSQLVDSATLFTDSAAWRADLNKFYSPFFVGAPDAVYASEAYAQIKNVTDCFNYDVAPCFFSTESTDPAIWTRACSTAETLSLDMNVYSDSPSAPQIAHRLSSAHQARALDLAFYTWKHAPGTPSGNTEACTNGKAHFKFLPDLEYAENNVKTDNTTYNDCPNSD